MLKSDYNTNIKEKTKVNNLTKDEVKTKILGVLQEADGKMNPSSILSKLGWKKDTIAEICNLFGVEKCTEVLHQFPEIEIQKDNNGTAYAVLRQNINTQENNKMAETEKTTENLHDRMEQLLAALNGGLYEKEEAVRLSLLTAVAGESMFLLGAPGCAKSMISRRIAKAFKTEGDDKPVRYFEYLMNQFSTPEEVFGNISLKYLNGETASGKEEYRRLTEGYLPEADIAFLDEIWKASPAILNSLLTIINERKFHNGSKIETVPLKALFSASNELPAKNQGLEALYDRFILRLCVDFIKDEDSFFEMLEHPSSSDFEISDNLKQILISNDELNKWKTQIDSISFSEDAKSVITAIRKELTNRNEKLAESEKNSGELFEVGDRRWKKIARILKTSAFLNGRTEVDLMDCSLIEHCIWNTEEQQKKSHEIVSKCIEENGLDCDTAIEDIEDQIDEFKEYITTNFYNKIKKPVLYKMSDGKLAYKCIHLAEITSYQKIVPYYICENSYEYDNQQGGYYDDKGNLYDENNYFDAETFEINENTISLTDGYRETNYSFEIEVVDKLEKNSTVFNTSDLLELRQSKADEKYASIKNAIDTEIEKLNIFSKEKTDLFNANLFTDNIYCRDIMGKIEKAKRDLQDIQVQLDKEQKRYQSDGK